MQGEGSRDDFKEHSLYSSPHYFRKTAVQDNVKDILRYFPAEWTGMKCVVPLVVVVGRIEVKVDLFPDSAFDLLGMEVIMNVRPNLTPINETQGFSFEDPSGLVPMVLALGVDQFAVYKLLGDRLKGVFLTVHAT